MLGKRLALHLALLTLLGVISLMSLRFGTIPASWSDLGAVFDAQRSPTAQAIVELRLPRTACAMLIGVCLGLAGLIFQIVLRNPLADPTIFGISSGASVAVVGAMGLATSFAATDIAHAASTSVLPIHLVPPIALSGGLLTTILVVWLAWQDGLSPLRLVLFGAVLAVALNGLVMVLVLSLSEARTELAILWLAGSLYARDFANFWPAVPWALAGLCLMIAAFPWLSVLRFDPHTAQGLGASPSIAAPVLLAAATVLAATAVSVAGPVGFVGLLVPHMARLLYGPALGQQAIGAALLGACLVVAGDVAGRIAAPPLEIPVGIVTSLIGAPLFAFLFRREFVRSGA